MFKKLEAEEVTTRPLVTPRARGLDPEIARLSMTSAHTCPTTSCAKSSAASTISRARRRGSGARRREGPSQEALGKPTNRSTGSLLRCFGRSGRRCPLLSSGT